MQPNAKYKSGFVTIIGNPSSGKSTLMNMVAGYLSPTSGNIFVNGNDVEKNDIKTKKDIGFLSEGSPLYQDMTVICFLKYMIQYIKRTVILMIFRPRFPNGEPPPFVQGERRVLPLMME